MSWQNQCKKVRSAQRKLSSQSAKTRSQVLRTLAESLALREPEILAANQLDLDAAKAANLAKPLFDRLSLSSKKLKALSQACFQLAESPDPIGQELEHRALDEDLVLKKVKAPLGVLLIIFESRPDAVIQIGSLAIRTGNAVLLKGGKEAMQSNRILIDCLGQALMNCGLDEDAVFGVESRCEVQELLEVDQDIDLVIPRGSSQLVRSIQEKSRIPVLGHAEGICHLVIDKDADLAEVIGVAIDSKCQYPAACNALETLLVHKDFVSQLGLVLMALKHQEVELRLCESLIQKFPEYKLAEESDWISEYSDLILSVREVPDLDSAIDHIHTFGSGHTESLLSPNQKSQTQFLNEVDAACVFVTVSYTHLTLPTTPYV